MSKYKVELEPVQTADSRGSCKVSWVVWQLDLHGEKSEFVGSDEEWGPTWEVAYEGAREAADEAVKIYQLYAKSYEIELE